MKTYILRFIERHGEPILKPHSVKFIFLFNVIQIESGTETVLQNKFPIIGAVSDLVIHSFQLDKSSIEEAALSCAVSCLKTEPNVQAVVNKEYMLGMQHLLDGGQPSMDHETEFLIQWDNK